MVRICTIGFSGRSAERFFVALKQAGVQRLIDIRRSNNTLYCGFTRQRDLPYLLDRLCGIDYLHEPQFAPSEELLRHYQARLKANKKDAGAWPEFVERFTAEIRERPVRDLFRQHTGGLTTVCLLCTEKAPEHCHRRLLAEYLRDQLGPTNVEINHL